MPVINLTLKNFDNYVLHNKKIVVVEFFTEWSGLSYIINSVLKTLENKYHNKTTFCRINIDQNKEISEKYGVYEIPTILFFKNGKVIDSLLGISPKFVIESKLSELIHINN